MGRKFLKRGFTLVETVVTVGIISALSAVVYPVVVKQFDSADPTHVVQDLNNLRTAIESFSVNVSPHQPGDIEDLVFKINTAGSSTDADAQGAVYSASSDIPRWIGPYLGTSLDSTSNATAAVMTTGFGGTIVNGLVPLTVTGTLTNTGGDVATPAPFAAADFLVVKITGLTAPAFTAINTLIDGASEVGEDQKRGLGRFRCPYLTSGGTPAATATCPAAYYLAVPFRH